jgi:hypothetical protein
VPAACTSMKSGCFTYNSPSCPHAVPPAPHPPAPLADFTRRSVSWASDLDSQHVTAATAAATAHATAAPAAAGGGAPGRAAPRLRWGGGTFPRGVRDPNFSSGEEQEESGSPMVPVPLSRWPSSAMAGDAERPRNPEAGPSDLPRRAAPRGEGALCEQSGGEEGARSRLVARCSRLLQVAGLSHCRLDLSTVDFSWYKN